jgi:hypothetical protein
MALTVGLPIVLATTILLAGRRRGSTDSTPWAPAAALGVAYLAGHLATFGMPSWPPRESTQWIVFLALAGLLLGLLQAWKPSMRFTGILFLSLAIPIVLLRSPMQHLWPASRSILIIFGIGVPIGGLWFSLRNRSLAMHGGSLPATWMIVSAGTALTMQLSGSASFAQLSGALAAACGVLAVEGFLKPKLDSRAAVPVLLALWSAFWICGWYYIEAPPGSILALIAGALVAWVPVPRDTEGRPTRAGTVMLLGLTAACVAVALLLARPETTAPGMAPY